MRPTKFPGLRELECPGQKALKFLMREIIQVRT